ncbi:MAG: pyrroloquinoline quinone precursor peptide PqqA [Gammaproteobacteria bacterium]
MRYTLRSKLARFPLAIEFTSDHTPRSITMAWQTPAFEDIRFGFEVTMYINNR